MKRRSFVAAVWTLLSLANGGVALGFLVDGDTTGYILLLAAIGQIAAAGLYLSDSTPVDQPDDPVPRRWFELAGLVGATLIVSTVLLFVTLD
jgi:peptidoglycan/LPS O-acetylase OafA/YrhL